MTQEEQLRKLIPSYDQRQKVIKFFKAIWRSRCNKCKYKKYYIQNNQQKLL